MECPVAEPLNQPISLAEVESALPLLNNRRPGAGLGWPAELLRHIDVYREILRDEGKLVRFHVLACCKRKG